MKVKPDVAVIYANGKKQAVGIDQYFKAGDLWFELLAVTPKTMKISVVGGGFAGGKNAITIRRNHPITLVNTATGIEYRLRFTEAAAGIATTSQTEPTTATTTAPAAPPATEPPRRPPATETTTGTPAAATTTTTPSGS